MEALAVYHSNVRLLLDGVELLVVVNVVEGGGGRQGGGSLRQLCRTVRRLPSLAQIVSHLLCQARVGSIQIIPVPVSRGAQLVLLLGLHPPVLEPDLDLSLRQSQVVSDLYPPPPSQVAVEMELLESHISDKVVITLGGIIAVQTGPTKRLLLPGFCHLARPCQLAGLTEAE